MRWNLNLPSRLRYHPPGIHHSLHEIPRGSLVLGHLIYNMLPGGRYDAVVVVVLSRRDLKWIFGPVYFVERTAVRKTQ